MRGNQRERRDATTGHKPLDGLGPAGVWRDLLLLGAFAEFVFVNRRSFPGVFTSEQCEGGLTAKIPLLLPPGVGIHAVKAIVTEGLNRDRIEPLRPVN